MISISKDFQKIALSTGGNQVSLGKCWKSIKDAFNHDYSIVLPLPNPPPNGQNQYNCNKNTPPHDRLRICDCSLLPSCAENHSIWNTAMTVKKGTKKMKRRQRTKMNTSRCMASPPIWCCWPPIPLPWPREHFWGHNCLAVPSHHTLTLLQSKRAWRMHNNKPWQLVISSSPCQQAN